MMTDAKVVVQNARRRSARLDLQPHLRRLPRRLLHAIAHFTASALQPKATISPSPSHFTSWPPCTDGLAQQAVVRLRCAPAAVARCSSLADQVREEDGYGPSPRRHAAEVSNAVVLALRRNRRVRLDMASVVWPGRSSARPLAR
jgi:hypothetical protein